MDRPLYLLGFQAVNLDEGIHEFLIYKSKEASI